MEGEPQLKGAKMTDQTVNGLTIKQWLAKVDALVIGICGMSVHDLCDFPIWDTWQDGASPKDALEVIAEWDDLFEQAMSI